MDLYKIFHNNSNYPYFSINKKVFSFDHSIGTIHIGNTNWEKCDDVNGGVLNTVCCLLRSDIRDVLLCKDHDTQKNLSSKEINMLDWLLLMLQSLMWPIRLLLTFYCLSFFVCHNTKSVSGFKIVTSRAEANKETQHRRTRTFRVS